MILSSYKVAIPGPLKILQILMLFGPGIVAVGTAWFNGGKQGVVALLRGLLVWRRSPLWYLAVLGAPAALLALSLILSNGAGFTTLAFPSLPKFLSTFAMVFAVYFFLNTEELAWRGYALPRLQDKYGVFRATFVIFILWTLFHVPLFLVKGGHPAGYPFWLYALMVGGIALPFTVAYNGTGSSILFVHILHQSLNASVEALPVYPAATHSIAPISIFIGLLYVISAVLAVRAHRRV